MSDIYKAVQDYKEAYLKRSQLGKDMNNAERCTEDRKKKVNKFAEFTPIYEKKADKLKKEAEKVLVEIQKVVPEADLYKHPSTPGQLVHIGVHAHAELISFGCKIKNNFDYSYCGFQYYEVDFLASDLFEEVGDDLKEIKIKKSFKGEK